MGVSVKIIQKTRQQILLYCTYSTGTVPGTYDTVPGTCTSYSTSKANHNNNTITKSQNSDSQEEVVEENKESILNHHGNDE